MLHRKIFLIFALALITFQLGTAQKSSISGFSAEQLFQEDLNSKFSRDLLSKTDIMPVGNVVVPENYFVGPGDALSIQNLTSTINTEIILVTSECSVMLPRIGEMSLLGKTLAEAKKMIADEMKKRNANAIVYVSLYQPRTVLITLKGNVTRPGAYSMPASYRVSTAIKVANQLQNQNMGKPIESQGELMNKERKREQEKAFSQAGTPGLTSFSSRNISLIHVNGEAQNCDLEKALVYNDSKYDPYIREGDEVFVPFNKENFAQISISGAVLRPVSLPWKEGDKVSFLLRSAAGLTSEADLEAVYLFTPGSDQKTRLNIDSSLRLLGSDTELKAGSSIVVLEKQKSTNDESGTVAVAGEVKNPGTYIIKHNKTKVKEVIEMAGGFKAEAYLPMSYILRKVDRNLETFNPNGEFFDYFQRSDLSMQDTTRFLWDVFYRKPYVSCDFEALFNNNSEQQNVTLQNGDMIVIPPNPKSVYVYGQVNNPGYVPFEPGKPAEWYIEKAGGFATGAEKERVRIIRAKNKVWFEVNEKSRVYAGDEIYVPKPPDIMPGTELQQYYLLATAVGTLIQVTYLIITLFK